MSEAGHHEAEKNPAASERLHELRFGTTLKRRNALERSAIPKGLQDHRKHLTWVMVIPTSQHLAKSRALFRSAYH